jgi:positive regulator of sigma E activity
MSACASANEASGVVVRIENDLAWIEVDRQGCGQCTGKTACGTGLLGLQGQARQYCLPNSIGAQVGDGVLVSVPSGSVLKGALLA